MTGVRPLLLFWAGLSLFVPKGLVAAATPSSTPSPLVPAAEPAATSTPTPTLPLWVVPPDAVVPESNANDPAEDQRGYFDDYSWRAFVALNWPAKSGERGLADSTKRLGEASDSVVWETWRSATDLFQAGGLPAPAWDSRQETNPCSNISPESSEPDKALTILMNGESILRSGLTAPIGSLKAQNGKYVRYEIRLNQPLYGVIQDDRQDCQTPGCYGRSYLRENLPLADGLPLSYPTQTIAIEAAWRILDIPVDAGIMNRYYHRTALIPDPSTNLCQQRTVGLVGLHIMQKTPTRPQGIWSSFEQVDNVSIGAPPPVGVQPSFNNPAGPQVDAPDGKKLVNILSGLPQSTDVPTQVTRLFPLSAATKSTNTNYQDELPAPWKYYQLIVTQWPTRTDSEPSGQPFPRDPGTDLTSGPRTSVANVTIETATQNTSCMTCHFAPKPNATGPLWFLAIRAITRIDPLRRAALSGAAASLRTCTGTSPP